MELSDDATKNLCFLSREISSGLKNSDYLVLEYIINKGQIGEEIYDELNHLNILVKQNMRDMVVQL